MPAVPPWKRPDNFSPNAHQRLVDAINAKQVIQPVGGGNITGNPNGVGVISPDDNYDYRPLYPVLVIQHGGTNGTASSYCDYYYDVYPPDTNRSYPAGLILSQTSVVTQRPAIGPMNAALWGTMILTSTGPQLFWVDEQKQAVACTSP